MILYIFVSLKVVIVGWRSELFVVVPLFFIVDKRRVYHINYMYSFVFLLSYFSGVIFSSHVFVVVVMEHHLTLRVQNLQKIGVMYFGFAYSSST